MKLGVTRQHVDLVVPGVVSVVLPVVSERAVVGSDLIDTVVQNDDVEAALRQPLVLVHAVTGGVSEGGQVVDAYLTRADVMIICSTVLVFGALVQAVMSSRWNQGGRRELALRIDRHARWIYPSLFGLLVLVVRFG